eukprot:1018877-Amphidinium_carterae.1
MRRSMLNHPTIFGRYPQLRDVFRQFAGPQSKQFVGVKVGDYSPALEHHDCHCYVQHSIQRPFQLAAEVLLLHIVVSALCEGSPRAAISRKPPGSDCAPTQERRIVYEAKQYKPSTIFSGHNKSHSV